ncbi:hypothetical protein ABT039_07985 [Streptomyces lasiicapitis]|uniref:hypothetical protein n=1 Tax=Streptomyces lasiicapitis TaxID=1923961 RepID=UPI00332D1098
MADIGIFVGGVVSRDRSTVVIWSDTEGGRLFVIRGGVLRNTIAAAADEVSVSGDGSLIAVTKHRQLKVFGADGGLLWTYTGDDLLRRPRVSPDGTRIAVGSELGTLAVLTRDGAVVGTVDLKALPVPAWLPDGDLLAATWMGAVARFSPELRPRWQSRLTPTEQDIRTKLRAPDPTPLVRRTWGNADATPKPLTDNLLKKTGVVFRTRLLDRDQEIYLSQQNDYNLLIDGSAQPPARPWLPWWVVNNVDSGWHGKFEMTVDTYRTLVRLRGVTIAEDPAHPESWLRDVRLQWWDTEAGHWVDGPMLLSDKAVHTHMFATPLVASWFRFVTTGGGAWPVGNLRMGELVFHGDVLGNSHRDVVKKRDRATLFEDRASDLRTLTHGALSFQRGDARPEGGTCVRLDVTDGVSAADAHPAYFAPFGHVLPEWDFEIAEHPEPGRYRYFQFAWKATGTATNAMALRIGPAWNAPSVVVLAGATTWPGAAILAQVDIPAPPSTWTTVRLDLWELTRAQADFRVRGLSLRTVGGGALYDQIVLGRTEADLPDQSPE